MERNDGGSAFPSGGLYQNIDGKIKLACDGMSLRDYFAAAALSGVLGGRASWPAPPGLAAMARACYEAADAMLTERAK